MHAKKGGKKTKKVRGGYYGAAGPIEGTTGAMRWGTGSEIGGVGTRGGNTQTAGRRRKSRKGTKKSKSRKMRGGNKYGGVSASFQGQGIAGMAQYNQTTSRGAPGTAAQGAFNNFGAAPGSKFNI